MDGRLAAVAGVGMTETIEQAIRSIGSYGRIAYFPGAGEYCIITQENPTVVDAKMISHLLTDGYLVRDGRTYQLTRKGRGVLRGV